MANKAKPPEVFGCSECLRIFTCLSFDGGSEDDLVCRYCTGCSHPILFLGELPNVMEDGGEFFLMGTEGFTTGPYTSEEEAQSHLWAWFNKRDEHGEEEIARRGEEKESYLRLVSVDGVNVKEEGIEEDGAKEGTQDSSEGEADKKTGPEEENRSGGG